MRQYETTLTCNIKLKQCLIYSKVTHKLSTSYNTVVIKLLRNPSSPTTHITPTTIENPTMSLLQNHIHTNPSRTSLHHQTILSMIARTCSLTRAKRDLKYSHCWSPCSSTTTSSMISYSSGFRI
jgi:hypothetical protein